MTNLFKVGDYIQVTNDAYDDPYRPIKKGTILPVVEKLLADEDNGYWISKNGVAVKDLNSCLPWARKNLRLYNPAHVPEKESPETNRITKYKDLDFIIDHLEDTANQERVKESFREAEDPKEVITPCTRNPETGNLTFGDLYKEGVVRDTQEFADFIKEQHEKLVSEEKERLQMYNPAPQEIDGIARPILSERKVGKVPVHMVIDGFPRALREVGKVLGWAADAKQYKLHDWKNLPDADIEFPSAGYRHMLDNSEMKSEGIAAIERVDHESHKLHLAHEIFNKLAELELVLTGVIK